MGKALAAARAEIRPAKVLVVDDEAPIRDLVEGYLRGERLEALAAEDGPSALAAVRRERPDVVVLDLSLPGVDGIEVCRQLRTFSDTYVIMPTARGENPTMHGRIHVAEA